MPKQYGYIRMISKRQAEGIVAAKARGKTWGKPKLQLDKIFFDTLAAWKAGEITCTQAAESCGMTLSNFRYHAGKQA